MSQNDGSGNSVEGFSYNQAERVEKTCLKHNNGQVNEWYNFKNKQIINKMITHHDCRI